MNFIKNIFSVRQISIHSNVVEGNVMIARGKNKMSS